MPHEPPAGRGSRDELGEAALAGLLPLGAHHPEGHEAAIAGRLRREELPGFRLRAEPLLDSGENFDVAVLERVEPGALRVAVLECVEARLGHPARGLQALDLPMLIALQMLLGRRGEKRCMYDRSSWPSASPSIQP